MTINFWFLVQPFATLGFVKYFFSFAPEADSKNVFLLKGQISDRKNLDLDSFGIEGAKIHIVEDISSFELMPAIFQDSINICFGFNSPFLSLLREAKNKITNVKIFVASELDTLGKILGKLSFLDYKAKKNYKRHHAYVDGILAFGDAAFTCFSRIGWKIVIQCHYIPDIASSHEHFEISHNNKGYLYVGRNDYFYKRLNYLISFFKNKPNLKLTIVGDYGPKALDVKKRIAKCPNIVQMPAIPVQQVFKLMESKEYKCVIIPSRFDACNVNVYMSIMCGMPFICSTGTGEFNIAKKADCGFVFHNSYRCFKKCFKNFEQKNVEELNQLSTSTANNPQLKVGFLMEKLYSELIQD